MDTRRRLQRPHLLRRSQSLPNFGVLGPNTSTTNAISATRWDTSSGTVYDTNVRVALPMPQGINPEIATTSVLYVELVSLDTLPSTAPETSLVFEEDPPDLLPHLLFYQHGMLLLAEIHDVTAADIINDSARIINVVIASRTRLGTFLVIALFVPPLLLILAHPQTIIPT